MSYWPSFVSGALLYNLFSHNIYCLSDYFKKVICKLSPDCSPYGGAQRLIRLVYTLKYPPITFSWDRTLFTTLKNNNVCGAQSYLIINDLVDILPENNPDVTFLSDSDSLNTGKQAYAINNTNYKLDGKIYNLYEYNFKFLQYTTLVATGNIHTSINIPSYPNPAADRLNITLPSEEIGFGESVQIYNSTGIRQTAAYRRFGALISLETGGVAPGIYLAEIVTNEKHRYLSKFLKE